MDKFSIEVKRNASAQPDEPHPIALRLDEIVFTRLIRQGQEVSDDYLRAPPSQLAFWFMDNWWRIRFECVPAGPLTPDWRLAHDMASVGGGYVWPRLKIWGEGERVGLASRSDPSGVAGPVRYITDALSFIPAGDFEAALEAFLNIVLDERCRFASDLDALRTQWKALSNERADKEIAAWRRLEAELGFDPDEAPDALITALAALGERYGHHGVEEAVQAHPGYDALKVLEAEISVAEQSGWDCDFSAAVRAAGNFTRNLAQPPWRDAEEAASQMRDKLGLASGPVSSRDLTNLAGIGKQALDSAESAVELAYGLRLNTRKGSGSRLAFRTRWSSSRRFELSRALGDAIWSRTDSLGPLARSKTARQKFQRAFAQSLLCPFDDLMSFMNTSQPTEDDIAAAARHFDVSEMVVRTTLVNKGVFQRERLEDFVEAA